MKAMCKPSLTKYAMEEETDMRSLMRINVFFSVLLFLNINILFDL